MAIPTSRDEFKEYCLRALGKPVLQINVENTQLEDRIDEALYVYQQHHYDAVAKTYMRHEVTASTLTFTGASVGTFEDGETVRGATSNTVGKIVSSVNSTSITYYTMISTSNSTEPTDAYTDSGRATFTVGEVITGEQTGATATLATVTRGDIDNRWFPIADSVIGITRVFAPFDSRISADILFDPQSQFNISLLSNFTANSIIPYHIGRSYQQLLNDTFRGRPGIRFSRHLNRLYVDVNWNATFLPGQHIVVEGFRVIDPDTYTDVWSDRWLQRYGTALFKRQWGLNLSKYTGIALPGGVQLDGKSMLAEANQEIRDLETELQRTYTEPPQFIVG